MRSLKYGLAVVVLIISSAAMAVTTEDVGDADSFGHPVKYLGAKGSFPIFLALDCAELGPAYQNCINISATGTTVLDQDDFITIKLPAFATKTLLCYSLNASIDYSFVNYGAGTAQSWIKFRPTFTIESSVLNNPSIIDPNTNLPLNGKLVISIRTLYFDSANLAPTPGSGGLYKALNFSKDCVGGMINKTNLRDHGLTPFQIAALFASPMTVKFNMAGSITRAYSGDYQFGLRLYGD